MAEKEYIEREAFRGRVKTHTNPYGNPTIDYESGVKVLQMIDTEPTADVVPRAELERALRENRALSAFKDYFDELYGQGLEIAKWHQNGDTEPFDSFYDSALDEYEAAFLSEGIKDETDSR